MRKPTQFKVKHVIVKTSKEELELHMKQAVAALLSFLFKKEVQAARH